MATTAGPTRIAECDHCGHEAYTRLGTRCLDCGVGFYVEAQTVNSQQQQARDRAVSILKNYVQQLFDRAGASASYSPDTARELEMFVDDIITAATPAPSDATAHVEAARRGAQRI
jgi:ribosomal protein L37E